MKPQTRIILVLILIGLVVGGVNAVAPMGTLVHNATYLSITTYDGKTDQVHPSIVYNSTGWNGYKYILAFSPYYWANDSVENPSIRYSNDGYTWEQIVGQPDPILGTPATGHNADPNIVLYDGTLYLFNVWGDGTNWKINRTSTTDGITWDPQTELSFPYSILSPSFYYNGTGWECWANNKSSPYNLTHFYSTSDGLTFTHPTIATGIGTSQWHSEVKYQDSQYHLLLAAGDATTSLHYYNSTNGIAWVASAKNPVFSGAGPGYWDERLYKSTFLESGGVFRVWYTGMKASGSRWHIGYAESPNNGVPPGVDPKPNVTVYASVDGYVRRSLNNDTFSDLVTGAGTSASSTGINMYVSLNTAVAQDTDKFNYAQVIAQSFDTSSIPDDATITDATLYLYKYTSSNTLGSNFSIVVTNGSLASNTALAAGDYVKRGSVELSSRIPLGDIATVGEPTIIPLNTSFISKTSYTVLFTQLDWYLNNDFTGTWASNGLSGVSFYSQDYVTEPALRPRLVVEYEQPTDTSNHPPVIFNWYCPAGRFCFGPFILWEPAAMAA